MDRALGTRKRRATLPLVERHRAFIRKPGTPCAIIAAVFLITACPALPANAAPGAGVSPINSWSVRWLAIQAPVLGGLPAGFLGGASLGHEFSEHVAVSLEYRGVALRQGTNTWLPSDYLIHVLDGVNPSDETSAAIQFIAGALIYPFLCNLHQTWLGLSSRLVLFPAWKLTPFLRGGAGLQGDFWIPWDSRRTRVFWGPGFYGEAGISWKLTDFSLELSLSVDASPAHARLLAALGESPSWVSGMGVSLSTWVRF